MREQIRAWKEEHRKFEKLLMLIEGELDVFRTGAQPHYPLLLDAVLYMTQYPVRFHDPKEDLAWRIVVDRLPSSARLVDSLHRQHALVARSGNDLRRLGDSLMANVYLPRAQVERAARGYIDAFRIQLGMEERLMLPLAQGLLSEDDWAGLRARFQARGDAASGTTMRRRYRALHRQIAREAGCGCATQ
jgi:hemerythrin-like domain-containing protein